MRWLGLDCCPNPIPVQLQSIQLSVPLEFVFSTCSFILFAFLVMLHGHPSDLFNHQNRINPMKELRRQLIVTSMMMLISMDQDCFNYIRVHPGRWTASIPILMLTRSIWIDASLASVQIDSCRFGCVLPDNSFNDHSSSSAIHRDCRASNEIKQEL